MRRLFLVLPVLGLLSACEPRPTREDYPVRRAEPRNRDYSIVRRGQERDYVLLDGLLFAADSAHLSDHARDVLAEVAADLRNYPRGMIDIEGHTDTMGTAEHNLSLSQARAEAVAEVLRQHGVAAGRMVIHAFGKTQLAVQTADQVSEPANRRVVIRVPDR